MEESRRHELETLFVNTGHGLFKLSRDTTLHTLSIAFHRHAPSIGQLSPIRVRNTAQLPPNGSRAQPSCFVFQLASY